jgi:hypothetical protein
MESSPPKIDKDYKLQITDYKFQNEVKMRSAECGRRNFNSAIRNPNSALPLTWSMLKICHVLGGLKVRSA